ncbi:MAG: YdeI/OmpD-associated family protein [Rhodoferax sp.]|nr:YdeI/OmpD-associated family protein [Rhodoferax sp.]
MTEAPEPSTHPLSREAWRAWLQANHLRTNGVWLVSYKKATGKPRFDYDAAVEEALCFGWVDSKPNKLDAERTLLWFAPRKPGSGWSRPNKLRIERMLEAGLMAEAGLRKVEQAKLDGTWSKLDAVEDLSLPEDLKAALAGYAEAAKYFEAFPRSAKRGILEWIANAKTEATRARRIHETALLASKNERANQWRPKQAD